jgi:hypothetical protein
LVSSDENHPVADCVNLQDSYLHTRGDITQRGDTDVVLAAFSREDLA